MGMPIALLGPLLINANMHVQVVSTSFLLLFTVTTATKDMQPATYLVLSGRPCTAASACDKLTANQVATCLLQPSGCVMQAYSKSRAY